MTRHPESYSDDRYPFEPFSPWRPSVWHLWLALPIVVAVTVVLAFYAVL